VALLERFHWMIYVLGAFLVYTAVRLAVSKDTEVHPDRNIAYRLLQPFMARRMGQRKLFTRRTES